MKDSRFLVALLFIGDKEWHIKDAKLTDELDEAYSLLSKFKQQALHKSEAEHSKSVIYFVDDRAQKDFAKYERAMDLLGAVDKAAQ